MPLQPDEQLVEQAAAALRKAIVQLPDDGQIARAGELTRGELKTLARAVLASSVPEDLIQWMPIETAPKDGSDILVAHREFRPGSPQEIFVSAARWVWSPDAREDHDRYPDDGAFLAVNNDWEDDWGGNLMPIAWKPFPDPPPPEAPQDRGEKDQAR